MPPSPDYRHFDLAGTHREIGRALGRATERFTVPAWWPPPPEAGFARACEREIGLRHPLLLEELKAYAEAQGVEYEFILRGICRRRMKVRVGALSGEESRAPAPGPRFPEGGCSTLAVRTADGSVVVGHNYDFYEMQRIRQRIRLTPRHGLPTLGTRGSVPGGRHDGVNSAGLFVALHVVLADEPEDPAPGLPYHLIPRLVLETCRTAGEARQMLTGLPHLHSFNYLVADPAGEMFVVETHPRAVRVMEAETVGGRPTVAATNHFRHPDTARFQGGRKLDHSMARRASLVDHAARASFETLPSVLAEHPAGVCGHRGGHTTLWSLTADLTTRRIAYTAGAPCEAPFEPVPWPG